LSIGQTHFQYEKLVSILDVLSDADALKILEAAKKGFRSGKGIIKELNLTPRKYYRTLKELNQVGIVLSSGDEYRLTPLGELLHRMLLDDLVGVLQTNQDLLATMQNIGSKSEFIVIDDYKNLISFLVAAIEKSKSEILLATKYLDLAVIQSIVYALERNVKLKTITSTEVDFSAFIKLVGGFLRNIRPSLIKFSIGGDNNYRSGNVPLSFVVIDDKIALFEIPNKQFKMAFVSNNKNTVKHLSGLFLELWNQSQKLHVPSW
jgi:DNA-binding HxlR family transcriptional regulator